MLGAGVGEQRVSQVGSLQASRPESNSSEGVPEQQAKHKLLGRSEEGCVGERRRPEFVGERFGRRTPRTIILTTGTKEKIVF